MIKILIAESLDLETLEQVVSEKGCKIYYNGESSADVSSEGFHFFYQPEISVEELEKNLHLYNGLVVRPKEVSGKAIESAPDLKLIIRGGAGLNSIDLATAEKCGVAVQNTPGQNSISTAEFTFALIIQLLGKRNITRSDYDSRKGIAGDPGEYQGRELAGKKIAIVGLGNIGSAVAKRAAAFDMEVIYYSRNKKDVAYKYFDSLHGLLSDKPGIVSLHVPLNKQTQGLIAKSELSLMKRGTILINCARPQLVDSEDFGEALKSGVLESAGIDGDFELIEPFIKSDPEARCILTHHIADSTKQAQEKITNQVLKQLFEFLELEQGR